MKQIMIIFLSILMLNACSKPVNNTETPLPVDQLENDDSITNSAMVKKNYSLEE